MSITTYAVVVAGWTGKVDIRGELDASLATSTFKPFLAVVADPAGRADLAATFDAYVIPSGLLNGIVSGLVSRSILNADLVGPTDIHACVSMPEHAGRDRKSGGEGKSGSVGDNRGGRRRII